MLAFSFPCRPRNYFALYRQICQQVGSLLGHTEQTVSHSFYLLKEHQLWGKKEEEWGAFPCRSTFLCLHHAFLSCLLVCSFCPDSMSNKLPRSPWTTARSNSISLKPISYLSFSAAVILRCFSLAYPSEFKFTPKRRHIFTTGILFSQVDSHAFSD